jgi:hypothetical protein
VNWPCVDQVLLCTLSGLKRRHRNGTASQARPTQSLKFEDVKENRRVSRILLKNFAPPRQFLRGAKLTVHVVGKCFAAAFEESTWFHSHSWNIFLHAALFCLVH